jgi:hypothetical protein
MTAMNWRYLTGLVAACAVVTATGSAEAQEIQVTGPLAGAPAVRKLRQHRKGRIEIAPAVSFTLLDEYQRTILLGARINYNITDWLAIGVWGGYGAIKLDTALSDKIQTSYDRRFSRGNPDVSSGGVPSDSLNASRRLTATNVGKDFHKQLGTLDWVLAPQITAVPFRGKISLFQKIFVDTDAYFFAGPAFVGMTERAPCGSGGQDDCSARSTYTASDGSTVQGDVLTKKTESRVGIAPTFGLGLSFYTNKFTSFGIEYRALPMVQGRNTGGFDSRGGGADERFPDNKVNEKDRDFKFNQMITLSFGFYLPTEMKSSD